MSAASQTESGFAGQQTSRSGSRGTSGVSQRNSYLMLHTRRRENAVSAGKSSGARSRSRTPRTLQGKFAPSYSQRVLNKDASLPQFCQEGVSEERITPSTSTTPRVSSSRTTRSNKATGYLPISERMMMMKQVQPPSTILEGN